MKLSLDWLGEYVEWSKGLTPQEIADRLTASVSEVDEVETQGALLEHCCVGQIKKIKKHPDADKLSLCDVETDQGNKRVVCGGSNIAEGLHVAFAHVGATVKWHGGEVMTLEKVKVRGEQSEGMICASSELGLEDLYPIGDDERAIIDLGTGAPVGESLKEYLGLTDTVIHIDNHAITHRPDLFSHIGFARECVSLGLGKWKKDPTFSPSTFPDADLPFQMHTEKPELMPRYCSCAISIDGIGETPDWMKRRLAATGWRSLTLPVDITNYVMMEVGVPLHSFDADDIVGDVTMREAKKGEKIVTLDKAERELPAGSLVLSDDEGIFDLLGIMGGLRSSTKESSKLLYLHSANLAAAPLRKAMITTGLRTDAGTVYEKGVPAITAEQGFYRAAELMCELIPGAKIVSKMDSKGDNGSPEPITLDPKRVSSYLGLKLTPKQITDALEGLEFKVEKSKDGLSVTPPLHRLGDISGAHDLIEEVGRTIGYDKIKPKMPEANITPPKRDTRLSSLRCMLKNDGFTEVLPLSFVSPDVVSRSGLDPEQCVEIENPLGAETSLLQSSLLTPLLSHAERVVHHAQREILTFTHGNVFTKDGAGRKELGLLVIPDGKTDLLHLPVLRAKRVVDEALSYTGYSPSYSKLKEAPPQAVGGRATEVLVEGHSVGVIFELQQEVASAFDLPRCTACALIDLEALFKIETATAIAVMPPKFPHVVYDLTCQMDHSRNSQELIDKIAKTSDLLSKVEIVNLYEEKGASNYRLTLRLTYQSEERTLKEEEVKKEYEKVEKLVS